MKKWIAFAALTAVLVCLCAFALAESPNGEYATATNITLTDKVYRENFTIFPSDGTLFWSFTPEQTGQYGFMLSVDPDGNNTGTYHDVYAEQLGDDGIYYSRWSGTHWEYNSTHTTSYLEAGRTYYYKVQMTNPGEQCNFLLTFYDNSLRGANNSYDNATPVTLTDGVFEGSYTVCFLDYSLYWCICPEEDGTYQVTTYVNDYDSDMHNHWLSVNRLAGEGIYEHIGTAYPQRDLGGIIYNVPMRAGETYYICIDPMPNSREGWTGNGDLRVTRVGDRTLNSDTSTATPIMLTDGVYTQDYTIHTYDGSLFWRLDVAEDGMYSFYHANMTNSLKYRFNLFEMDERYNKTYIYSNNGWETSNCIR